MSGVQQIGFWHPREDNGWLTNFWMSEMVIDGVSWPSVEHYYQAMKHEGTDFANEVRAQKSARKAKDLARSRPYTAPWWVENKIEVMRRAIRAKFTQHADLRQMLIDTGNAILVETSPEDSFWGEGAEGKGVNMMGLLLMELRCALNEEFKEQEGQPRD